MNLNRFEKAFAVAGFLLYTAPYGYPPFIPGIFISLHRYSIWGGAILLLLHYRRHAVYTLIQELWLWALMFMEAISFIWSLYPPVSISGTQELVQMSCFALYVATRFSLREQVHILARTFNIGAVLSVLVVLAMPAVGIHGIDHPGSWRGVFDYKNTLGSFMVAGAVTNFLIATDREGGKRSAWFWVGFCLALVVLSTSKSALVISIVSLGTVYFCRNFSWRGKKAIVFLDLTLLIIGSSLVLLIENWFTLLDALGKDPTLTGRLPLWDFALKTLVESPWIGFGRASFFSAFSPYGRLTGAIISGGSSYIVPHAHNGFIDLLLDVGVIGLGIFLVSFVLAYGRATSRAIIGANAGDLWPIAFLTFVTLNNLTESFLLRQAQIYWVIYIIVALSMAKQLCRDRRKAAIEAIQFQPRLAGRRTPAGLPQALPTDPSEQSTEPI